MLQSGTGYLASPLRLQRVMDEGGRAPRLLKADHEKRAAQELPALGTVKTTIVNTYEFGHGGRAGWNGLDSS